MTATFLIKNGDIVINQATGRPMLTVDTEKLRQDVRQNLTTTAQSNGTGSSFDELVGRPHDIFSIRSQMSQRIYDSFNALKSLQNAVQRSDRTTKERLDKVVKVTVLPNVENGQASNTSYVWRVDVSSADAKATASVTGLLET